jgi:uncharacterized membrane protein
MSNTDIFFIIQWSLTLFFVGIPFIPFTSKLFPSFFDRGYIFAKILGMAILSYTIFLLGIFHLLPFSRFAILFVLFMLTFLFNVNNIVKKDSGIFSLLREKKYIFLFEEGLFFVGIVFWSWVRTFSPDIHGLEKFMDYGFINSLLRSDYFPPKDMWFTPFVINYYYFGHVITAVLTKLSSIPSNITFNLMIATIFSLCFSASFSLSGNLYSFLVKERFSVLKFFISGILSAVTFSGNLHILYTFFTSYDVAHPKPFWQMAFSPQTFPNAYWYPNATRFIYNTIHEFPMYSWVVSDLHGHVLDIPFVLLTIALLLSIFFQPKSEEVLIKKSRNNLFITLGNILSKREIIVGFLLAVMYMTNAWDGLIYLLLASIIFACKSLVPEKSELKFQLTKFLHTEVIHQILTSFVSLFVSFVIFSFPFSYFFKPFVSGIGILSAPDFLVARGKIGPLLFEANHTQHSPWWQLLILYGFFLFFTISYALFMMVTKRKRKVDLFILLLIFLSLLLIIVPEFIYVKDIYPEHYRANTMFKLVFQAFIMLSLVSGFVVTRILLSIKNTVFQKSLFSAFFLVTTLLLVTVLSYPYFAITSYYNNLQKHYSLDGTVYLKNTYPDDYSAITWIQNHISGQPVILEAQGDSYTDYARISSYTGLPTVLGWTVHEWLWRGTYDIPAPRIEDVKTLYETSDVVKTKILLKKYNISYIYIGELEQQKYQVAMGKFMTLGKTIFKKNNTTIIKLSS